MMELATLGVSIDATPAASGSRVAVQSFNAVSDAVARTGRYLDELKRIQELMARESEALGTSQQSTSAAVRAGAAQYDQARAALEKMGLTAGQVAAGLEKMGFSSAASAAAQQTMSASVGQTVPVTAAAATNHRRLQQAVQGAALAMAGIPGPIGRVVTSLGALAVGGGVTVAVVAGLSAVVGWFASMGKESREAKRELEELIQTQVAASRVRTGQQWLEDMNALSGKLRTLQQEARELQAILDRKNHPGFDPGWVNEALARNAGEQSDVQTAQGEKVLEGLRRRSQMDQQLARQREAAAAEERRRAEEARRHHEERLSQLQELARVEAGSAVARAQLARDVTAEDRALHQQAVLDLEQRIAAMGKLDASQREAYRTAGLLLIAAEEQRRADQRLEEQQREAAEAERERIRTAEQRASQMATLTQAEAAAGVLRARLIGDTAAIAAAEEHQLLVAIDEQVRKMDGLNESERERLRIALRILQVEGDLLRVKERIAQESAQPYLDAVNAIRGSFTELFTVLVTDGTAAGEQFARNIQSIFSRLAAELAQHNLFDALFAGAGTQTLQDRLDAIIADLRKELASNPGLRGGFAGATVGLGVGYATGHTGGGVLSGAFTGLAASGGNPYAAIAGGVAGLVGSLLHSSAEAEEAARRMAEAREDFARSLEAYVEAASGGSTELSRALRSNEEDRIRFTRDAKELARERFRQLDLGDLADGDAAGIFRDLEEQLAKIAGASKDLEAQLQAEHAARLQALGEDLRVRELRALGLDAEADALAMTLAHQREWLALQQELGKAFDQTLQDQLAYVQGLEVEAAAKAKAEEAARKAAELAERQQHFREDLEVRALAASGDTAGAEALRRRIAYEREYAEAVKAGMDETTLAMLRNVQAAEELAIAQAEAAEKAQDLIDAMNAEARAMENLEVRHYRAIGQHDFAEEARMRFEHEEETRRAIEEGRSDSYMQFMRQVQQEERDAFTKQRQDAQQKAWDDAVRSAFPKDAKFLEDRTSVNLAVGVSESTVNRMVGVLQSQLVYQASLPRIESVLYRMETILRGIRDGSLDLDAIDQGLATLSADSDLAAGVPPGNR